MGRISRRAKMARMSGPWRPPSCWSAVSIVATTLENERFVAGVICQVRARRRPI